MARTGGGHRVLDFWLGVPALMLVAGLRARRRMPENPQRIGVISPTAIGDLILDSGFLLHLRTVLPRAEIHLFHGANNAGAVALLPVSVHAHTCHFTNIPATLARLRRTRLDVIVDLTPWPRLTALYAALSGATTVGFRAEGQLRHVAFDLSAPHLRTRHEVENLRALAEVFAPCPVYQVLVRRDLPEPSGPLPRERFVLFHIAPGGSRAADKSWPAERWVELARRLVADDFRIGFTGARADAPAVEAILSAAALPSDAAFSLCGQMSLAQLAGALRGCCLLVTVDTGVLHLASALEVPTVALHGPTRSWRWGARSAVVTSLDAPHPCAGAIHFGFETSAQAAEVMKSLTVEAVYDAARRVIARRSTAAAEHPS